MNAPDLGHEFPKLRGIDALFHELNTLKSLDEMVHELYQQRGGNSFRLLQVDQLG